MHRIALTLLAISPVFGQALVEHAAAAAGSTAGAVAGKKVSEGIDKVFGKVGGALEKAAKAEKNSPLLKVGPAQTVPKGAPVTAADAGGPVSGTTHGIQRVESAPLTGQAAPALPDMATSVVAAPAVPPAPQVTADDLAKVNEGLKREALLAKLGPPVSKITTFEDGKVVEIYRYANRDQTLGAIHLTDGAVSNVIVSGRQ